MIPEILEPEEADAAALRILEEIEKFFATYNRPQTFEAESPENAVNMLELRYESIIAMLESNGCANAANLSVWQFYARLSHLKKETEALKQR